MTVMPGVGFGYPCSTYVPCLFAFRASADEETEMPRAQTSNPSRTDVLLLLAMTMEFLRRFPSLPGNSGASGRRSQRNLARSEWLLVARAVPQQSKRTGSVSRGFPSGSETPLYHIDTGRITRTASRP